MEYKPGTGDVVEVYVRTPYKVHIGSPMTITDAHYNGGQLHYVNAVDCNGEMCELFSRDFGLKLLKTADGSRRKKGDNR